MGKSLKAKVLKWLIGAKFWLIAIGGLIIAVLTFGMSQKRMGKKIGAAKERAKGARDRVKKAAARGDDAAILREWRKSRKP